MDALKNLKLAAAALLLVAAAVNAQDSIDNDAMEPTLDQVVPVADETLDESLDASSDQSLNSTAAGIDAATVPELDDEYRLVEQFERYKQLMKDGVYDEADSVAKRVVELAIRVRGPDSMDFAKALTNLAIVQHNTRQHDAAQQNFQSAIDIIEDNEDRLNGQLINPLKGLGAAQLEGGRPDLASGTFRRAVHVTHVNEGPHNLYQLEILESLAESNLRLGATDVAKEVQDTIYALNLRQFADNSLELVPSLMRRAAWQHRAGFIFDERTSYRRVIRIIELAADKNDLRLVEPLTNLGKSFFYVDTSGAQTYQAAAMTTGEIYFKRALRIATENPDSDWQIHANTSLALGDYYMYEGNEQRARRVYRGVWDLLSEDESRLDFRREALEELVTLKQRPIPQYINPPSADAAVQEDIPLLRGKISISYAVSTRGRATNLKIVEAEPPQFEDMVRSVQREMRRRIYRPLFEDAVPVQSDDQLHVHRFFYTQTELDAVTGDVASTEVNDKG